MYGDQKVAGSSPAVVTNFSHLTKVTPFITYERLTPIHSVCQSNLIYSSVDAYHWTLKFMSVLNRISSAMRPIRPYFAYMSLSVVIHVRFGLRA